MHCLEWTSHVSVHANLKVPIQTPGRPTFWSILTYPPETTIPACIILYSSPLLNFLGNSEEPSITGKNGQWWHRCKPYPKRTQSLVQPLTASWRRSSRGIQWLPGGSVEVHYPSWYTVLLNHWRRKNNSINTANRYDKNLFMRKALLVLK